MNGFEHKETGWIADDVDERDKTNFIDISVGLPASVDLRAWCSPIKYQGSMKSCTAHAAIALVEYFEKRAFGNYLDASRLFLYKVTRNLLKYQEDRGANPRTTMKALAMFGVPPEDYWSYEQTRLYEEPPAFVYALASQYKALKYYRIDVKDVSREVVLEQIKANLAASRPLMFAAILHHGCFQQAIQTGKFPIPSNSDTSYDGHTMAAVGYDDTIKIQNTDSPEIETIGALLIKNSWENWGDEGYGWIPYEYVLRHLSYDWWTISKQDWLDTGKFEAK